MFRTFVKVRHASVPADPYPFCYGSSTNTNPRLSIKCWSGGCCFISLCSAICGVSVIRRKSAMSRPLAFCSSVALSSRMLLMTTLLQTDCSNGIFDFHLSVAPRSGNRMMSRPPNTLTAIWLRQPCIPPVASQMKLGDEMGCDYGSFFTLDYSDRHCGMLCQQMLTKETLAQVEIWKMKKNMRPSNIRTWLFHTMSVFGIIQHDLASPHFIILVNLPING